jgi:glutaredoxin
MNIQKPIIVYGTQTCPKCDDVVSHFDSWGVRYEQRDIFAFQGALEDILMRVGYTFHLPIVRHGAKIVMGHQMDRIIELLRSAGYLIDV